MSQTQTYQAIVIKKVAYRDYDLILNLFTKEVGKIAVFASNARRSIKRFGPYLDLFAQVRVTISQKSSNALWTLQETSLIDPHLEVRSQLWSLGWMSYYVECLSNLLAEHDPHESLFDHLAHAMSTIKDLEGQYEKLLEMEFYLLQECGYNPDFSMCSECKSTKLQKSIFLFAKGSVVCLACKPIGKGRMISENALAFLRNIQPINASVYNELRELLSEFVTFVVGKPMKSHNFFKESHLS